MGSKHIKVSLIPSYYLVVTMHAKIFKYNTLVDLDAVLQRAFDVGLEKVVDL